MLLQAEARNPSYLSKRGQFYEILCAKDENDGAGNRLTEGDWSPLGRMRPGYFASTFSQKPSRKLKTRTSRDKTFLTRAVRRAGLKAAWFSLIFQKLAEKESPTTKAWLKLTHLQNQTKKKRSFIRPWQISAPPEKKS